jgi:hypothetical protein
MSKIIGLDLDGVIIDHTENRLTLARSFGFKLTKPETPSDIMKLKLPEQIYKTIQLCLYDDPKYALTPPLVNGSKTSLKTLCRAGHQLYLVSRRQRPEIAIELLKRRGLWPIYFNETNVFFVKNSEEKNRKAGELHIKTYLDDQPSVLAKLLSVTNKFLLDPHRAHDFHRHHLTVVNSWKEFLRSI